MYSAHLPSSISNSTGCNPSWSILGRSTEYARFTRSRNWQQFRNGCQYPASTNQVKVEYFPHKIMLHSIKRYVF